VEHHVRVRARRHTQNTCLQPSRWNSTTWKMQKRQTE
jgi:hypothetical protein